MSPKARTVIESVLFGVSIVLALGALLYIAGQFTGVVTGPLNTEAVLTAIVLSLLSSIVLSRLRRERRGTTS